MEAIIPGKFVGLSLVLLSTNICNALPQNSGSVPPNIILILADDMGFSDLGCYGSEISTPNLDMLAEKGARYTHFYNASRCCPTRASLLTGLYQHQAGVGDMVKPRKYPAYQGYLNNHCVTLAEVLKSSGYNTYMSGKWHVGSLPEVLPLKKGFDRYFGLIDGAGSYFERISYRKNSSPPRLMLDSMDYEPPAKGFYFTDAITDYAISFLKDNTRANKPFFLYLAYTAPHWPLHAPDEDIRKYQGKYSNGWDSVRKERFEKMKKIGIIEPGTAMSPRDEMVPDWETLTAEEKSLWDLRMSVYAAMVDRMDQNIGRLLKHLKETDVNENTLIIFLSDNGGCHEAIRNQGNYNTTTEITGKPGSFDAYEYPWANVSNTPFRMHKHWVHEGGISTPCIMYYPKEIKPNTFLHNPAHIIDLMPTLLDYANGTYPLQYNNLPILPMEGITLRGEFTGEKSRPQSPLFWEHEGNRAMLLWPWKLVSQYDYSTKSFMDWELYKINHDRTELNNLASKRKKRTKQLISKYEEWADRVGVVSKETLDKR